MAEKTTRVTLDQVRKLKSLSNAQKVKSMTDEEIEKTIESEPDLYQLTDEELAEFEVVRGNNNGNKPNITRVTLEEAKKKKGQSNLGKLLTEQQREKQQKNH
jgi:hypothetical protein